MKIFKRVAAVLLLVSMLATLCGCFRRNVTFGEWTENELYQNIPAMYYEGNVIGEVEDYGDGYYVLSVSGTSLENYNDYLKLLGKKKFEKYYDNGENGLNGTVYTATYTKDNLSLTVTHMVNLHKTYFSVKEDATFSPHLFKENASTEGNKPDAKTTLHMLQVEGNAFVIQLKNGHFICSDTGTQPYMQKNIEYMESLVPAGEKPIVEAWFFSHDHNDHTNGLKEFMKDPSLSNRVIVESVYFSELSDATAAQLYGGSTEVGTVTSYTAALKNSEGKVPPLYRPHAGERYYFNDIMIEIPYTQEQIPFMEYEGDINGSSLWMKFYIEDQTFLLNGDTERNNVNGAAAMYDQEYFDVDIMAVFHHGHNIHAGTETYFQAETLLYPSWGLFNNRWGDLAINANNIMMADAEEAVSVLNGTVVVEFPYTLGSYKVLDTWYPDETQTYIDTITVEYEKFHGTTDGLENVLK